MPVATKTGTKKRIVVETEVETKAEPDVVVDEGLAGLLKEWHQAKSKEESYFPRIVQYVIDNEVTNDELKAGLMQLRGMAELTARNEVSKINKARAHPDLVKQAIDKKITVRQLREKVSTRQAGTDDPETKFKKKFRAVASFAINDPELNYDEGQFLREAKRAYKDAYARAEANAAKERENGAGSEGEDTFEDEDEE